MDNSKQVDVMRKIGEDVKYLGSINIGGEEKQIYLKIEKEQDKDGNFFDIEKYYTNDLEFLAGNNEKDGIPLTLDRKFKDNEKLLDQLEALNKKGMIDLKTLEEKRLQDIAESMGVEKEKIRGWQEIDANQKVEEDEKEEEVDLDDEEIVKPNQNKEPKELGKEQVEKLDIREKTDANQMIKGKTLASKLKLSEHGIVGVSKIARAVTKNGEDRVVALLNNGKAVVLGEDILKKDPHKGTNYSQQHASIKSEDGKIGLDASTSRYMLPGSNDEYLEFGWDGDRSGKEIRYTMRSHHRDERGYISIELKNTSVSVAENHDVRKFLIENINGQGVHGIDHMKDDTRRHARLDGIARQSTLGKESEENIHYNDNDKIANTNIRDVDHLRYNNTHVHVPPHVEPKPKVEEKEDEEEYEIHDHIPPSELGYHNHTH